MRHVFFLVCFCLVVCYGCRSRRVSVEASALRRSDSVATLRSIGARALTRETETVVVTMRRDTIGRLVEVARDITRTVTKEAETSIQGDTAAFHAETTQEYNQEEKTAVTATQHARRGFNWFVAGVWLGFTALVTLLAAFVIKKGATRWT